MVYEPRKTKVIMEGFDVLDTIRYINASTKKSQAVILSKIEVLLGEKENFPEIRKAVLDGTNDLAREIVKNIFGEVDA